MKASNSLCNFAVAATIFLSHGCTTSAQVGSLDDVKKPDYVELEEERWAVKQSDIIHEELLQKGLVYTSSEISEYLSGLEQRLLKAEVHIQQAVKLFALKSPIPNAMALPNGNIYVNAGLFSGLDNEAQLAAIISHEIIHVWQKHSVKAIISQKNNLIGAHVGDFLTGGFGLVYLGAFANIMHFSREQETQSDELGLLLLTQAGYPASAMLDAFKAMAQFPELEHQKGSIYSSHPQMEIRMGSLERSISHVPQTKAVMSNPSDRFLNIKAQMMEDTVKNRIRSRYYITAQNVLEIAKKYFKDSAMFQFYMGETYYGMYKYPESVARERYWIETGKDLVKQDIVEEVKSQKYSYMAEAQAHYMRAASMEKSMAKALRRLGELSEAQSRPEEASEYYMRYLEAVPDASDRAYVERALSRLEKDN